jgi:hypothetical protein
MWRGSTWRLAIAALSTACSGTGDLPPLPDAPAGYTGPIMLEVDNHAAGVVTSSPAGIACPTTCRATFAMGTGVVLTLTPTNGSQYSTAVFDDPCAKRGDGFACGFTIGRPTRINVYGAAAN